MTASLVLSGAQLGEEGKVAVRNIRRDILKQLDKDAKSKDAPISEVKISAATATPAAAIAAAATKEA